MNKLNIITKLTLTVVIVFSIIILTAFGTIKIVNYRENALLDNEIKAKIGVENFGELDRVETKIVKTTKYYLKDGMIIEDKEVSEGTTNYNQ